LATATVAPRNSRAAGLDEGEPDRRPISVDNPRIWPAVAREAPLLMGAVEAFRTPARAAEMGVQFQRILFDWSVIQRQGPDHWSFGWSDLDMARAERDAGRPMIGQFISTPSWASGTSDPKSPPLGLNLAVDDPRNLWAAWVGACVKRFAGVIDSWVMWNEPDVWSDEAPPRGSQPECQRQQLVLRCCRFAAVQRPARPVRWPAHPSGSDAPTWLAQAQASVGQ
jgi:hypothetical protein